MLKFSRLTYTKVQCIYSPLCKKVLKRAAKRITTTCSMHWATIRGRVNSLSYLLLNPSVSVSAFMTLIDFTLSNARRFYLSMANPSDTEGLRRNGELHGQFPYELRTNLRKRKHLTRNTKHFSQRDDLFFSLVSFFYVLPSMEILA